jgi:hypothetical protein
VVEVVRLRDEDPFVAGGDLGAGFAEALESVLDRGAGRRRA